jgi:NADPH-dependent 2,4-dienoyl-CoA reductase/sulfur reductase-like enzyme
MLVEITVLANNENKIVIIGNGSAAAECIKALRDNGYNREIHVCTSSKWPIANPMLTTYYAAGKISFDQLFPYGKGDEFYRKYRVEVHSGSPVVSLDVPKRVVINQSGLELDYRQCLIASGASPVLPSIEGVHSNRVYYMRTVEDAVRLKETMAKNPRKALVIGASMVGVKLVEVFFRAGMEVCLADIADHIFPLSAHTECASFIEDRLKHLGIRLRFGASVNKLEDNPGGIKAYFTNNESELADLAVLCIGMRPNVGFINRQQVEVKQGVLVDEYMRTSATGLFAAGDASQGKNLLSGMPQIIALWDNARYQGRTAGRNMVGINEQYPGNIPHNIVHFLGMDFVSVGDVCRYDKVETRYDGERFSQLFWKESLLTGANFVNTYTESGIIKNALIKGLSQNKFNYDKPLPIMQNILIRNILSEVEKNEGYPKTAKR